MQYLLQIYMPTDASVWERLSEDEQSAITGEYFAIMQVPGVIGGAQLQPPASTTTVRVQDDATLSTDGPFVETKEVLGGYSVIEADSIDDAVEVAKTWPPTPPNAPS